ncbi:MAG: hypothetical protein CL921_08080 [Deltaproteobacteria bacterium]|nr:hypothetical protein [Deltaproteobacteria bacterium]
MWFPKNLQESKPWFCSSSSRMCVPFSLSATFARFLVRFFTQFCAASASFFFVELKMNLKSAQKAIDG